MKRIISLILILSFILSIAVVKPVMANTGYDAFEKTVAVSTESLVYHSGQASGGRVQLSQHLAGFTNLDLGDKGIVRLSIFGKGSKYNDAKLRIYLYPAGTVLNTDGTNGLNPGYSKISNGTLGYNNASVNPNVADVVFPAGTFSNDWSGETELIIDIPNGSEYTGLYDLIIGGAQIDMLGFQFHDILIDAGENQITMSNNDITKATEIGVENSVSVNAHVPVLAELYLAVYDKDHNLLYVNKEQKTISDATQTELFAEITAQAEVMEYAKYVGAFLLVDGKLVKSNYINRVMPQAASQSFGEGISAESSEGKITVLGASKVKSGSVMLWLKNGDEVLYVNEIPTNNGNFEFEFSPDVPTDTYTVAVTDIKRNEYTASVDFVSFKRIIEEFKSDDREVVRGVILNNSDVLGIDTSLAEDTGDAEWIYNMIYENRASAQNVAAIKNLYNHYVALALINCGQIDDAISNYSEELGLSQAYIEIYEAQSDGAEKLNTAISAVEKLTTSEDFVDIFYKQIVAGNVIDAYTIMKFVDSTDKSDGFNTAGGVVGDTSAGRYVAFHNLDFGDELPKTVAITYGVDTSYANTTYNIFIDDKTKVTPDIKITTKPTGGWDVYKTEHYILSEAEASKLVGVHDIYVVFTKQGQGNFKDLVFTKEYLNVEAFNLSVKNSHGEETVDLSEAVSASATLKGYAYTGTSNSAYLVLAAYDENGALINNICVDKKESFDNTEFNLSAYGVNLSGAKSVMLSAFDAGLKKMSDSKVMNLRESKVTEQKTLATSSDGKVRIYGETENSGNVTLFVRKSDVSEKDFANYALVYEVKVLDGVFSYEFKMPEKTQFNTGEYVITVIDSKGVKQEASFRYASLEDIKNALTVINRATDAQTLEGILNSTHNEYGLDLTDVFEIDLTEVNASSNKSQIYQHIYAMKGENFLSAENVKDAVDAAKAVDDLNNGATPYDTVADNAKSFGLTDTVYYKDYFKNINEASFNTAFVQNGVITGIDDTVLNFKKAVIIAAFNNEMAWGKIDKMFNDFNDILLISKLGDYNLLPLDTKYNICNKFVGRSDLTTIGAITSLFDTSYKPVIRPQQSGGSSSSDRGIFVGGAVSQKQENTEVAEKKNKAFSDLNGYEWANEAITFLADRGIISGKGEGFFAPGAEVTREEFVKILVSAFDKVEDVNDIYFTDVDTNAWYYPYIKTAAANGIVQGYEDGSFGVGKNITREEIAVMVSRAITQYELFISEKINSISFIDFDTTAEYARESIMYLARAKVLNGVGGDLYQPKSNTKRAEAAVIIYRILCN